jgi:hypothetical protein
MTEISNSQPRNSGGAIYLFIVFIGFLSPFLFYWLLDDCGVIPVGRTIKELDGYAESLKLLEEQSKNFFRPPSYVLAEIDGAYQTISQKSYKGCIEPATDAMTDALLRASIFYGHLPVNQTNDDGKTVVLEGSILQDKYAYEAALRDYYKEITIIKSCYPFCNLSQ